MDTRKEYILQCEKAKEIQEMFNTPDGATRAGSGDFVWSKTKKRIAVLYFNKHHGGPPSDYIECAIWLPRQDQLQEMVKDRWATTYGMLMAFYGFSKNVDLSIYGKTATMEQLWLAFVMSEKYNKVWTGDIWKERA